MARYPDRDGPLPRAGASTSDEPDLRRAFFRRAKQDLGLANCHSTTEEHHHAHLELFFTADTILGFTPWEMNKEKTSDDESYTHDEMVRCLFHTRCTCITHE